MKLAELLLDKSHLQKKISELKQRIVDSGKIQEGDEKLEDVDSLLKELDQAYENLNRLSFKIADANFRAEFGNFGHLKLAHALIAKENLSKRIGVITQILGECSIKQARYTRNEIKFVNTFSIADLRTELEELTKQRRNLDVKIQELNWNFEVDDVLSN